MNDSPASQRFVAACVQLRGTRSVDRNIEETSALIREAARQGADYVQTPENTHLMELDPAVVAATLVGEEDDPSLKAYRALARELGIWLHIGSLGIRVSAERAANRAFVIAPDGALAARYDKVHMFDVDLPDGESYRESANYRPGTEAMIADLPWARFGISICYDLRFAYLYRALAHAGAEVLTAPAAFTKRTGEAHWNVLQRARAIETGCFVISAAQGGHHENGRDTFGHSIVVDPWGEVLAEAGTEPGVVIAEIDLARAETARRRVPALEHDREVAPPPIARRAAS